MQTTKDLNGTVVGVGTRVRILGLSQKLLDRLDHDEAERVRSMLGEVFEVYEIDEYGNAWVEKWWECGDGERLSHSIALEPGEMGVV